MSELVYFSLTVSFGYYTYRSVNQAIHCKAQITKKPLSDPLECPNFIAKLHEWRSEGQACSHKIYRKYCWRCLLSKACLACSLDTCAHRAPWNSQSNQQTAALHIPLDSVFTSRSVLCCCTELLPHLHFLLFILMVLLMRHLSPNLCLASWQHHAAAVMLQEVRHTSNPAIKLLKWTSES